MSIRASRNRVAIGAIAMTLTGCLDGPLFMQKKGGGGSLLDGDIIVQTTEDAGDVSGQIRAAFDRYQELQAASGTAVEGASVLFPPGALAIDADVIVGEGADAASTEVLAQIGLDSSTAAGIGSSLYVSTEASTDPVVPMTLSIPLPSSSASLIGKLRSLFLDEDTSKYAVTFIAERKATGERFVGFIPNSEITFEDGKAIFETSAWGTYRLVELQPEAEKPAERVVKATEAIAPRRQNEVRDLPKLRVTGRIPVVVGHGEAITVTGENLSGARAFIRDRRLEITAASDGTSAGIMIPTAAELRSTTGRAQGLFLIALSKDGSPGFETTVFVSSDGIVPDMVVRDSPTTPCEQQLMCVPKPVPGPPAGLTGTAGDGQVTLTWTAPTNTGGSAITDYVIQYKQGNATSWETFADGASTATTATVTGLTNETAYIFRVAAVNSAGTGPYGQGPNGITPTGAQDTTPPSAGSFSTSTNITSNGFTLNWTAATDNVTAASALAYRLCSGTDAAAIDTVAECDLAANTVTDYTANSLTITITNKSAGTTYHYNVIVRDAAGNKSIYNGIAQATSAAASTAPGAPTSVTGTPGNGEVTLTWTAPVNNGGAAITDYVIQYSSNNGSTWTTFADGTSTATTATVTGLTNGTNYIFRVAAVNSTGTGPYGQGPNGVTPASATDTTPPTAGSFSASTNITSSGFTLNWTAATDNVTAANNLAYRVCSGASPAEIDTVAECDSATTVRAYTTNFPDPRTLAITGKSAGTTYYYNVIVRDAAGNKSIYNGITQATPATVPGAPTSVTATPGDAQVALTWTAPTNTGGSPITDYVIQQSSNNGTSWTTFADGISTATAATVTGLTNNLDYIFRVAAKNAAGEGAYSTNTQSVRPTAQTGGGGGVGLVEIATIDASAGTGTAATTKARIFKTPDEKAAFAYIFQEASGSPQKKPLTGPEADDACYNLPTNITGLPSSLESEIWELLSGDEGANSYIYNALTQAPFADDTDPGHYNLGESFWTYDSNWDPTIRKKFMTAGQAASDSAATQVSGICVLRPYYDPEFFLITDTGAVNFSVTIAGTSTSLAAHYFLTSDEGRAFAYVFNPGTPPTSNASPRLFDLTVAEATANAVCNQVAIVMPNDAALSSFDQWMPIRKSYLENDKAGFTRAPFVTPEGEATAGDRYSFGQAILGFDDTTQTGQPGSFKSYQFSAVDSSPNLMSAQTGVVICSSDPAN